MHAAATTALSGARSGVLPAWTRLACAQCRRSFATSPALASGHNRWSKIKHTKGAADAKKNLMRSNFTRTLTLYSQMYGADLMANPQLAATVAAAKKAGVPKATIEGAIARGQGRSADGARLEPVTYEIMMPPTVALIVDMETESKGRALQDLNSIVRRRGGSAASTKFFFSRRGRVVLGEKEKKDTEAVSAGPAATADDILEDAIEAGAEDVEMDEDGNIVIWTPPNQTAAVVTSVAPKFGLAVLGADTIWAANEDTLAPMPTGGEDLRRFIDLLTNLRSYPDVRAIYANAAQGDLADEKWEPIEDDLDW